MKNLVRNCTALKAMREDRDFNLKTSYGYLMYVGGILAKLEGDKLYFAINGKWSESQ